MLKEDFEMMKEYYPQFFNEDGEFVQELYDTLWYGIPVEEIAVMCYKNKLNDTDYLALKHYDGFIPDDEYVIIKATRQHYRERIEELS